MKSFSSHINEARRSKIRPDAKHGDEPGVTDKSNNVATVNITDEKNPGLDVKGPDGKAGPRKRTLNTVQSVVKQFKETLEEGRGRPKKNATEDDPGSEHVVMQLRKVISTRGNHKVTHVSGEKSEVSPAHAHKMLAHHDNLKTSSEKDAYSKRLHRSASSMKDAMAGKAEPKKTKISLAGKITGTQSESVGLDVTPKTGKMTHVTINSTPRNKATNAPTSAGPLQRAATNRSADLQQNAEAESKAKKDEAGKQLQKRKTAERIRRSVVPRAPEARQMPSTN